jgi:predicted ATPase/DNA-binding SARP family transcriptional activator
MEFGILGPLQAGADGTDVTPRAAKPRLLFARLLVDANRVVAAERLIEDVWDDDPPPSAATTLQGYVSQLRKALGPDRLLTKAGGYELVVEAGELDAQVFEAEVAEGRRTGSLDLLRHALGRWRGAALADAAGAAWATPEIARLEELRLLAVESYLDALLATGDNAGVIAAAEFAVAEHPLRERLWAILMTALYRDGRQADALRAFQRLRQTLGEELGIEPSRELVELDARMVRQEFESAPPRSAQATSGILTFLFTDLESSTRLWDEHEAAMSAALERHDALLREVVTRNDGRVMKTTGDGTFAVFANAAGALQAAAEAQRALEATVWGETGPLRARIALHTGEAEQRDDDYFGPTLNRAARLMGIAHGGQVLVSNATEALVRDAPGVDLVDLGEHRLRDLSRPERVFQLVVSGVASDFPPLRSLDALPTNLPVQLTSFIGRVDELRRVPDLVREHQAVTITGVGGVGKTRLALQAAGEMIGEFADGAWYCELAAATDEETMVGIIAATLNVPSRSGMTIDDSIVEFFRHKEMLLVLDNCEHLLVPAARFVDRVLRASPRVRAVVTSREALDVDGERVMPLRSMTVAAADTLEAVSESDAVRLFVERAGSARADFRLDAANAGTVNTICRRLDGIPLAIELAAVRVVSMSPSEIASLLDERFRLLTGGRRIALERHQTLRATVEWSYDLLDERERPVFDRLAVFAGSFDATAARAVVTDDDVAEWDVIDALDGLVRKSLVIAEEQDSGATRYQLLETLRQYARERLDERGETDAWRLRHATYFATLSEHIREGLLGPDEFVWRARREPELDNIRVAIAWAIDREDTDLVLSFILSAMDEAIVLWSKMGRPATRVLPFLDRFDANSQVALLMLASLEAYEVGDITMSAELANRAEDMTAPMSFELMYVAVRGALSPDFGHSRSRDRVIEAVLADPDGLESVLAVADRSRVYASLGQYLFQGGGDLGVARAFMERAHELALESRNPSTLALVLFGYGSLYAVDDPDRALAAFDECIELHRRGAQVTPGGALYISALILARRGDGLGAITRLRESVDSVYGERGRTPELDGAFGYALEVLDTLGEREASAVLLGAIMGGVLEVLRSVTVPPDRTPVSVKSVREAVGVERFRELAAEGAAMSYDQLVAWFVETLQSLERKLAP